MGGGCYKETQNELGAMNVNMDGLEEKIKGDMDSLKSYMEGLKDGLKVEMKGLTKLLKDMLLNGDKIVHETHDENIRNVNHNSLTLG